MTTTPAPAPQKTEKGTKYVVLAQGANEAWYEAETVSAPSANQAVKKHVEGPANAEGSAYVAIPARSWKPVKVTVETTKTVRLGDA